MAHLSVSEHKHQFVSEKGAKQNGLKECLRNDYEITFRFCKPLFIQNTQSSRSG